jgi:ribosomal protein S27AE
MFLFLFCFFHSGIREFCCRLCNYKGVTQSDLNRHMKSQIHLLKSNNECKKCGEGFVTAKHLEKHLSAGCDGTHNMDMETKAK